MQYPKGVLKRKTKKNITYGKRGMSLEKDINDANEYYLNTNIACIYKKPTPIQVVKTDGAKINKAYYKTPSTTDYNGIYKGYYIDFEAKETNLKNFPLSNIHEHQIKHLIDVYNMGGISFIIVYFKKYNEIYILESKYLSDLSGKIDIDYFKEFGYLVEYSLSPLIDYIKIIDLILEGKNERKKK